MTVISRQKIAASLKRKHNGTSDAIGSDLLFELDFSKNVVGASNVKSVLNFNSGDQNASPTIWCRANGNGGIDNLIGSSFSIVGTGDSPSDTSDYGFGLGDSDHQNDFAVNGKYFEQTVQNESDLGTQDFFLVLHCRLSDLTSSVGLVGNKNAGEYGWWFWLDSATLDFSIEGSSTIASRISISNYDDQQVQIIVAIDRSGSLRMYLNGNAILTKDVSALSNDDISGNAKTTLGCAYTALAGISGFSDLRIYNAIDIGTHNQDQLAEELFQEYSGQKANKAKGNAYPIASAIRADAYPHFVHRRSSNDEDLCTPISNGFPTIEKTSDERIRFAPQKTVEVGPICNYDFDNTTYWNHRGTFAANDTDGPHGLQGKFRLSLSTAANGDIYSKNAINPFTGATTEGFGVFVRRSASTASEKIHFKSPYVVNGGEWIVTLSLIEEDKWTWITKDHPSVQIVLPFANGNNGHLHMFASASIVVDVAFPTFEKDLDTQRAAFISTTTRTLSQEQPPRYNANDGNLIQGQAHVEMRWRCMQSDETWNAIFSICDETSNELFLFSLYDEKPRLAIDSAGGETGRMQTTATDVRDGNDHVAKLRWKTNDAGAQVDSDAEVVDTLVDPSTSVTHLALFDAIYTSSVMTEGGQCEYFKIKK